MSSPTARRRQRSTRLTVAVSLLTFSAVLVTVAFLDNVAWFQAVAAVSSVVLGAAATRITYAELLQSRREAARDRAAQAQAYRQLTDERTAEHADFVTTIQGRVGRQAHALTELEVALAAAQRRAAESTLKFNAEARRVELADRRVARPRRGATRPRSGPPSRCCGSRSWSRSSTCCALR